MFAGLSRKTWWPAPGRSPRGEAARTPHIGTPPTRHPPGDFGGTLRAGLGGPIDPCNPLGASARTPRIPRGPPGGPMYLVEGRLHVEAGGAYTPKIPLNTLFKGTILGSDMYLVEGNRHFLNTNSGRI